MGETVTEDKPERPEASGDHAGAGPDQRGPGRRFTTAELFGTATEISITHEQAIYRLRITRQGKLILNK